MDTDHCLGFLIPRDSASGGIQYVYYCWNLLELTSAVSVKKITKANTE